MVTNEYDEELIQKHCQDILNTDEVSALMTDTNTDGWSVRVQPFTMIGRTAMVTFTCKGEQKAERTFSGDTIFGKAVATVDSHDNVTFKILHAEPEDVRG